MGNTKTLFGENVDIVECYYCDKEIAFGNATEVRVPEAGPDVKMALVCKECLFEYEQE